MVELDDLADVMKIRINKSWARMNTHYLTRASKYLVRLLRHDGNRPVNSRNPLTGTSGMGLHCDSSGWYLVRDILEHVNTRSSRAPHFPAWAGLNWGASALETILYLASCGAKSRFHFEAITMDLVLDLGAKAITLGLKFLGAPLVPIKTRTNAIQLLISV